MYVICIALLVKILTDESTMYGILGDAAQFVGWANSEGGAKMTCPLGEKNERA